MEHTFPCPVCDERRWVETARYELRKGEPLPPSLGAWASYVERRRQVLFEIWSPGREELTIAPVYCQACGFMAYRPRPTEDDLRQKYEFLPKVDDSVARKRKDTGAVVRWDLRRARRVKKMVERHRKQPSMRVLDFGGGDGRLLKPFAAAGHACDVVDYETQTVDGVRRVGSTLADLGPDERYDVIICSHVLEHVAHPAQVLARLREHLDPDGVIYGEVPVEIWKTIPIKLDPVTHINFFNAENFGLLFERAGFQPLLCRGQRGSYGHGNLSVAIVIARPAVSSPANTARAAAGVRTTRSLLQPSPAMRLRKAVQRLRLPTLEGAKRRAKRLLKARDAKARPRAAS